MNPSFVLILGNDDIAGSLHRILQNADFKSQCTATLEDALCCAREFRPSCLILPDVVFSGVSFWEAVSQIRAVTGVIPAILIWRKDVIRHYIEHNETPYISVQKDKRVVFMASHAGDLPGANGVTGSWDVEMSYPVKPADLIRFVKLIFEADFYPS
jgi:hypothetical protein